jgi:hypothetical protein
MSLKVNFKIDQDVWEAAEAAYNSYCETLANLPESPTEQELLYVCSLGIMAERDRCARLAAAIEAESDPRDTVSESSVWFSLGWSAAGAQMLIGITGQLPEDVQEMLAFVKEQTDGDGEIIGHR